MPLTIRVAKATDYPGVAQLIAHNYVRYLFLNERGNGFISASIDGARIAYLGSDLGNIVACSDDAVEGFIFAEQCLTNLAPQSSQDDRDLPRLAL
jgi:hypothetical protein